MKNGQSSMSTVITDEPSLATGDGWRAEIHLTHVYLAVDPETPGDPLTEAVMTLLSPTQTRYWTIQYAYEEADGWDVYLMQRMRPALAAY